MDTGLGRLQPGFRGAYSLQYIFGRDGYRHFALGNILCPLPWLPQEPALPDLPFYNLILHDLCKMTPHESSSSSSSVTMEGTGPQDVEAQAQAQKPRKVAHWKLVLDQTLITPEVANWPYKGKGTEDDPFVLEYIRHDLRDPLHFPSWRKWVLTLMVAFSVLAVAFVSSAYTGGIIQVMEEFGVGSEVATLGISLYVLGFAIGPLFWAPLSELYGRQVLFISTYGALTVFIAGATGSKNIQTLLILRFFAGAFGSSPLTNAGGVVADMFPGEERGVAMSLFAIAPFMGPTLGPIAGGFLGAAKGWRWVEGLMAILTGTIWIAGSMVVPETYSPFILRSRAAKLSKKTGKIYKSKLEIDQGGKTVSQELKKALFRPWALLFFEPIVSLLSLYLAIAYGTLYMMFPAFPIIFERERGWSQGIEGLSFLGVMFGMVTATLYTLWDNRRYSRVNKKYNGEAPPEARLPLCLVGPIFLPIGLFWFAWTNSPHIHWSVSIIGSAPFGFGMVTIFMGVTNYLIDSYVIYAASVLAGSGVLRSLLASSFPLFTTYMYDSLGIHWASSIPAFLGLACMPFPFIFYKYGESIRLKCKYASEAAAALADMRVNYDEDDSVEEKNESKSNYIEKRDEGPDLRVGTSISI